VTEPATEPIAEPVVDAAAPAAATTATDVPLAPPPLLAAPPAAPEVAGPPLPEPSTADRVIEVLDELFPTGALEAVRGVFFVSSAPASGAMLLLRGSPLNGPFKVGSTAWRMLLYAVAGSETAGGFVLVVGPGTRYGRLGACRAGSVIAVFGRGLGHMRRFCLSELTHPGRTLRRLVPQALIPQLAAAARILRAQSVPTAAPAMSFQSAPAIDAPAPRPSGQPAPPAAPSAPTLPLPSAPAPAPASAPSFHDGGRAPVSGILAAFAPLAALMFAGFVRLRYWPPTAPTARLLASPG
jgi:hypothetical protein